MTLDLLPLPQAIAVGIGATAVTDLWGVALARLFGVPAANYCLVGRWVLHMPDGVFRHASIAKAATKPAECAAGWLAHYAIGSAFALMLMVAAGPSWLHAPTVGPALLFGLVTVVFPYFIMQPAFGLGVAAARTPNPTQARLRSLMTHAVFGFGLYVSGLVLSTVI
jgi:hypothetical protein